MLLCKEIESLQFSKYGEISSKSQISQLYPVCLHPPFTMSIDTGSCNIYVCTYRCMCSTIFCWRHLSIALTVRISQYLRKMRRWEYYLLSIPNDPLLDLRELIFKPPISHRGSLILYVIAFAWVKNFLRKRYKSHLKLYLRMRLK